MKVAENKITSKLPYIESLKNRTISFNIETYEYNHFDAACYKVGLGMPRVLRSLVADLTAEIGSRDKSTLPPDKDYGGLKKVSFSVTDTELLAFKEACKKAGICHKLILSSEVKKLTWEILNIESDMVITLNRLYPL